MKQVLLDISLTVEGPILTKATSPGKYGVDSLMAVDSSGRYYLPSTLVKGKFREAWEELRAATSGAFITDDKITKWLGCGSDKAAIGSVMPGRGLLHFSDFVYDSPGVQDTFHRICIDRQRGSVKKGALQVIESPFAPGSRICFHGSISFIADDSDKTLIIDTVEKGLRWIPQLGAHRTVGFGRLINVAIKKTESVITEISDSAGRELIGLVITPKAPFCIAKRKTDENLFESEEVIPGGVIKGALASQWGQVLRKDAFFEGEAFSVKPGVDPERVELCENFEKIRFSHAFPARNEQKTRPVVPPLSLVKAGKGEYYDVALCETPVLIGGRSPEFAVDWKSRDNIDADFGWTHPPKELRVRTAIDKGTRRAEDEKLFAYEMVVPDLHKWYASIDLSSVPEGNRVAVEKQLRGLLGLGLNGWGKTKVSSDVKVIDDGNGGAHIDSHLELKEGLYVITLQTQALLCDPASLNESSGKKALSDAYSSTWRQISDESLVLRRFFASQTLTGGRYLHQRFQAGKAYSPYLLTDAGSVFVFEAATGKEKEAQEKILEWKKKGLPLPSWANDAYRRKDLPGDHWSNCPYIPENGYGEIAVNLNVHWKPIKDATPVEVYDE